LAIVLGAMTHLAWDSFTHGDGWIVRRAPALQVHLATLGGYEVFVFKVLQHGSTIVGAGVLAIASGLSLRSARSVDDPSHRLPPFVRGAVWLSCGLAAAAVALARSAEVVQPPFDLAMLQRALGRAVVPSIGTALALLLLYCLAWQLVERARPEWTS
ncbi:MAG TPA: DUF4184 family protein, partial [Myxococcota bacterium]|nr:DUF4184 family protein [Myxococcota bacterium]